jgi:hypothetical protein
MMQTGVQWARQVRARQEQSQIAVFFIDDNFAINIKRTKSLLRAEELVDLMAASGARLLQGMRPRNSASPGCR